MGLASQHGINANYEMTTKLLIHLPALSSVYLVKSEMN